MRINTNIAAIQGWRAFHTGDQRLSTNLARLSSGRRLNAAKDDVAGIRTSQNFMSQMKGLVQASRNAANGISLVSTAEAALQEVTNLLHRGRELSVQASNGTLGTEDRRILQGELSHLLAEIDRIFETTSFNGINLFDPNGNGAALSATLEGLQNGWLSKAEEIIQTYYGLTGDGVPLKLVFEKSGSEPAWVVGTPVIPGGKLDNLELHINLDDFGSLGGPDGGTGPVYNDRKVARAMTEILLARNSDFVSLTPWFVSGVSDFIAGGNEMLQSAVNKYGAAAVVGALSTPWADDDLHKASAYLAVKYLNSLIPSPPFSMTTVMQELVLTNDLNAAFAAAWVPDVATFENDFSIFGAAFLSTLDLNDPDVGGIGGGDASGVIPDGTYTNPPLAGFTIEWPSMQPGTTEIVLQVGANEGQVLTVSLPEMSRWTMGLIGVDLVNRADEGMQKFDRSLNAVSSVRSYLGSIQNRLEHSVTVNNSGSEYQLSSYSRIADLDYASEMTGMVKNQILLSASSAILAQANTVRQNIMWLFRDLKSFSAS